MKKLLVILIPLLLLGCVELKASLQTVKADRNVVLDCQCHEEPWKYSKHFASVTSCKSCHGEEVAVYHKNISGWNFERSCTDCHDDSLLANHMPKGCELCHGDPAEIHERFLEKYEVVR